ncbi:quinolinate synthase NadA [Nanoarchaeota archaeon]
MTETANMTKEQLKKAILELKKQKNAVILAHNYQIPDVYDIADFVGDSLDLAKEAQKSDADLIILCGVDFMAESAKLLNPKKKVLIPNAGAKCPMAAMIDPEGLKELKAKHPDAVVVSYVNTTADVKAESDVCCTSANSVEVVNAVPAKEIIFTPDKNLAKHVERNSDKKIIPWPGYCIIHEKIDGEKFEEIKKLHPNAKIIAHPECSEAVLDQADFIASTSQMIKVAEKETDTKEFIIATEIGMVELLSRKFPDKKFYAAPGAGICPTMKSITLGKVYESLKNEQFEVNVPEEIAEKARKALEKMLEYTK